MPTRYELIYSHTTTAEDGEVLGNWLTRAAEEHATALTDDATDDQRRLVADLFRIAADAFTSAADATLGQPRFKHYSNRAFWLRKRADQLEKTDDQA